MISIRHSSINVSLPLSSHLLADSSPQISHVSACVVTSFVLDSLLKEFCAANNLGNIVSPFSAEDRFFLLSKIKKTVALFWAKVEHVGS